MKICLVRAELFHSDGQAETKKLIVIFCDLVNAPNTVI
jgi:hypothetical protein